jgi:hypothetical protein
MFFNARWYDASLGRFAQADTLIPGAGDSQAWDRYAYANNDPVRYVDPSGHWFCEDVDAYGNCHYRFIPKTLASAKKEILTRYGVTLSDDKLNWNFDNATTILNAFTQMESVISKSKMKSIFSGQVFYMESGELGTWGGRWSNGTLKLHGDFPVGLVLHEVAHIFDTLAGDVPSTTLENNTIQTADGQYVGGVIEGSFQRSELGFQITWRSKYMTGYKIGNQNVYTQLHPPSWESYDPAGEEFADMFMNYVAGTFANDPYGLARMLWMTTNMSEFISKAIDR